MIEGRNINLRILREADLAFFIEALNRITDVGDFFPLKIRSESGVRKQFAEQGYWHEEFRFMLIEDKKGKILGHINARKSHQNFTGLEIGYRIYREQERGKGIMTEALRIFSSYLFDLQRLPRLYLAAIPGNTGSIKVAENCGFKYECTLRSAAFNQGGYCDLNMYSLLREECPHLAETLDKLSISVD